MKKILKSFFCNTKGNFVVPYFWATLFLSALFTTVVLQLLNTTKNYTSVLTVLSGMSAAMIALYNQGKKKGGNNE